MEDNDLPDLEPVVVDIKKPAVESFGADGNNKDLRKRKRKNTDKSSVMDVDLTEEEITKLKKKSRWVCFCRSSDCLFNHDFI